MLAGTGARLLPRSALSEPPLWTVEPEWQGETGFVVCGGPSRLAHDLSLLRDRPVVVINASFADVPFAPFMLFTDADFWNHYGAAAEASFKGQIVAINRHVRSERLIRLNQRKPTGLSDDRSSAGVEFTTATGAIDLLHLLGVKRIVAIGLDGAPSASGRTHAHAPYVYVSRQHWDEQRKDLERYVAPLKSRNIEMLNASPGSAIPFWPIVKLTDVL